jgi:tRNA(Arg) A34 adenosine deaminase TadA
MYASGIPCPMCMAAMIASGVERVVYCADDEEGEPFGWSTESFYKKMQQDFGKQGVKMEHLPLPEKRKVYEAWQARFGNGSKQD